MAEPAGPAFNLIELGIALLGSAGGSAMALWKAATMVGKAEERLNTHHERLEAHDGAIAALGTKVEHRHEEHMSHVHKMEVTLAGQPTKDDFQRLENYIRAAMSR